MDTVNEKLIEQAVIEMIAGNKAAARELLSQVVANDPENERARRLLSQLVEVEEILEFRFEKAPRIEPDYQKNSNEQVLLEPMIVSGEKPAEDKQFQGEVSQETRKDFQTQASTTSKAKNDAASLNNKASPTKSAKKSKSNLFIIIILIVLIFVGCGVCNRIITQDSETDTISNSSSFDEADAVRAVQEWIPKNSQSKGLTCQESYDLLVYFYKNNLGISDARVEWSANQLDENNFTVFAKLKGETGWANYSWGLRIPDMTISTSDSLAICATN